MREAKVDRVEQLKRHLDKLNATRYDTRALEEIACLAPRVCDAITMNDLYVGGGPMTVRQYLATLAADALRRLQVLEETRQRQIFGTRKEIREAVLLAEPLPPRGSGPVATAAKTCCFCGKRNAKRSCSKCSSRVHPHCRRLHEARCNGVPPV
jgi:hypothetical protein